MGQLLRGQADQNYLIVRSQPLRKSQQVRKPLLRAPCTGNAQDDFLVLQVIPFPQVAGLGPENRSVDPVGNHHPGVILQK